MKGVFFVDTHAPETRFQQVKMHKVFAVAKGFPGSTFEDIEADTCGFISKCYFDESRLSRVRFVNTGFTAGSFKDVEVSAGSQFVNCDFSATKFEKTVLSGVKFLQCSMTSSQWSGCKAQDSWFMGGLLRGVDFGDTELARAVFADADLEETKFQPDKTIGADFRGTIRALE